MTTELLMGAGAGSRFASAGYSTPKPFIYVDDTPMFLHVAKKLGSSRLGPADLTFVTTQKNRKYVEELHLGKQVGSVKYIPDMTAAGPAWSAVAATLTTDPFDDLLLIDSDCFVDVPSTDHRPLWQALCAKRSRHTQCVVFGNTGNEDPGLSAICEFQNKIYIREGGVHQMDVANIGMYWFKSVKLFRLLVDRATRAVGLERQGEVKISDVVNMLDSCETELQMINGRFINLGTPDQLAAYQRGLHGATE